MAAVTSERESSMDIGAGMATHALDVARVISPLRRAACKRAAREAGLHAGHVRLYVGTWCGEVIYRVSVDAGHVWQVVHTVYDPQARMVVWCECYAWDAWHVCPHAGAVYELREQMERQAH